MIDRLIKSLDELSRSRKILWILFFAAIATRIIGAIAGGTRSEDDDHWHLQIAQNFMAGNGLRLDTGYGPTYSWIQPGLAVIHVFFMMFTPNFYFPERIFLHLFSAAAIIAYFFIAKRLFPPAVALVSTIVLILYPPQWFWMTRLNPHSFATNILIFCFLFFFIAIEKKNFLLAFVVGFMWGALTLMRPEYELGIFALCFACLFLDVEMTKKIGLAAALFAGIVVFLTPWVIRNYRIHQRIVI